MFRIPNQTSGLSNSKRTPLPKPDIPEMFKLNDTTPSIKSNLITSSNFMEDAINPNIADLNVDTIEDDNDPLESLKIISVIIYFFTLQLFDRLYNFWLF